MCKNLPNQKREDKVLSMGEKCLNFSDLLQVVLIQPLLCFLLSFGGVKTYLGGLLECKDSVIRSLGMQITLCVENVVFYYKMTSKSTKMGLMKLCEGGS